MIDFMLKEEFKSGPWVVHIYTTCMHTTCMPKFGFELVFLVARARAWALPFWRWWGKNVFENDVTTQLFFSAWVFCFRNAHVAVARRSCHMSTSKIKNSHWKYLNQRMDYLKKNEWLSTECSTPNRGHDPPSAHGRSKKHIFFVEKKNTQPRG